MSRHKLALAIVLMLFSSPALAMEGEHGGGFFHMIRTEIDWSKSDDKDLVTWDATGWLGGDRDKLWLRSEGEIKAGEAERADLWAMYSRNVASYWDLQLGFRQDFEPEPVTYAVIGVEGLGKYFFETAAHAFVSDEGDVSARIEQSFDLPITQRLIAQPHLEVNLYAQDILDRQIGAGLSGIEAGLQLRYEIIRKFAPYVDVNFERSLGETAGLKRAAGEDAEEFTIRLGIRFGI